MKVESRFLLCTLTTQSWLLSYLSPCSRPGLIHGFLAWKVYQTPASDLPTVAWVSSSKAVLSHILLNRVGEEDFSDKLSDAIVTWRNHQAMK